MRWPARLVWEEMEPVSVGDPVSEVADELEIRPVVKVSLDLEPIAEGQ